MAKKNEKDSTHPEKSDILEIPVIYERFKEVCDPKCKDNKSIFVLIIVFMYSPISFANNHISKNGIRKGIAKVLGLKVASISIYFNNAKSLIINHRNFRLEVERIYELLTRE